MKEMIVKLIERMRKLATAGDAVIIGACALMLAGCNSVSEARYSKTTDGAVLHTVRISGRGDKASEVTAQGMFADDDGAGVAKAGASQQSTGIADSMRAFGEMSGVIAQAIGMGIGIGRGGFVAEAGGAVGSTSGTFAGSVTGSSDGAPDTASTAYSAEGFAGQPGTDGTGVYGRPSCSRCQAYKRSHPDTAIIDIDEPGNRSAMWRALRSRGYGAGSIDLPVLISANGYTQSAR